MVDNCPILRQALWPYAIRQVELMHEEMKEMRQGMTYKGREC